MWCMPKPQTHHVLRNYHLPVEGICGCFSKLHFHLGDSLQSTSNIQSQPFYAFYDDFQEQLVLINIKFAIKCTSSALWTGRTVCWVFYSFMVPTWHKKIAEDKIIEGSRGLGVVLSHRLAEHIQRGAIDGSSIELKRKKSRTFYDSLHCLRQEAINQQQGHSSRSQNRSLQHRLDWILVWPRAAFDTAAFPWCGVKYSGYQWHRW